MSGYDACVQSADGAGFSSSGGGPGAAETCPLNRGGTSQHPCYIESLEFLTGKQSVKWTHAKRSDHQPRHVRKALKGDNLLMQVVSDSKTKAQRGKPVEVAVAPLTRPACPGGDHPITRFVPVGDNDPTEWTALVSQTFEVPSRPTKGIAEGFFDTYWPFGEKGCKTYFVTVESCGIPEDPTQSAPGLVAGRIESYRPNSLKLVISLPPLKSKSSKRSDQFEITTRKRTTTRSDTTTGNFGRRKDENKTEYVTSRHEGDSHVTYTTTRTLYDGMVVTSADRAGMKGFEDVDNLSAEAPDLGTKFESQTAHAQTGVSLVFNGRKVDAVKFLGAILKLPSTITKFVEDLKNSVPKIGWTAEVGVEVMVGQFVLEWYLREKDYPENDLVWLIDKRVKFSINCTLFKAHLAIGFGVEWVVANPVCDPPLVEAILKVSIGLEASCPMELTFDSSTKDTFEAKQSVISKPNITATATATVYGNGCKAESKIETGLYGEFVFKGSLDSTPTLKGEVGFKPIVVIATIMAFGDPVTEELFKYPEKNVELWKADIL